MTVIVYIPNWLPMAVMSSISTILPAIRNRMPIGAYLRIRGAQWLYGKLKSAVYPATYWDLPHDYCNQPHDRFIETVKEVPEGLSLFPHASYDQTKAEGEHHQTKCIDSINWSWYWDCLLSRYLLATIEREYRVIHCHRHMDYPLGILGLILCFPKQESGQ